MVSVKSNTHVDLVDYIELPTYGGRARDRRNMVKMPNGFIPFHPTHTVRVVFNSVTFRTNVEASSRGEAERKAMHNLRSTFWPEARLRELGPIRKVEISGRVDHITNTCAENVGEA